MANKASAARQETAIGEGLAVACISLGVPQLPSSTFNFKMAFEEAWNSWEHASKFPRVRVDIERNVIIDILHDSPRRRGPRCAYWEVGREIVPVITDPDCELEELGEYAGNEFGVDLEAWEDLARPLLTRLGCIDSATPGGARNSR